jgi:antitoxin (DNA-binding transcriptional repressor) of toxin-antitoxin stability system
MIIRTVTATELARGFSDFLNQVRYQGVTLDIRRGNETVARIQPAGPTVGYPIEQLDALIAALPSLAEDDAASFLDDIHEATANLTAGSSAWDS